MNADGTGGINGQGPAVAEANFAPGGEFAVNTTIAGQQTDPKVTVLTGGGYLISWFDSPSSTVRGQLYQASGAPDGGEFHILAAESQYGSGESGVAYDVAALAGGGFVAVSTLGVAQKFDGGGAAVGAPIPVFAPHDAFSVWVETLASGDLAFVYVRPMAEGTGSFRLTSSVIAEDGTLVGGPTLISGSEHLWIGSPTVVALDDGGYWVGWGGLVSRNASEFKGQRFGPDGQAAGARSTFSPADWFLGHELASAGLANGNFAVAYEDGDDSPLSHKLKVQLFDASAVPIGDPIVVATGRRDYKIGLAPTPDGGFVVTWDDGGTATETWALAPTPPAYARIYSGAGLPVGPQFEIGAPNGTFKLYPDVAVLETGTLVFAWEDETSTESSPRTYNTPSTGDIRAQAFTPDTAPVPPGGGTFGDDVLIGTSGVDTLNGLAGNDWIEGRGAADLMIGGTGDDRFLVDNPADEIDERAGEGRDIVYTSVSYALDPDDYVEVLSASDHGALTPLSLVGNDFANELWGNLGNNILDGGGGADVMVGYRGDDRYWVDDVGDIVVEQSGQGRDIVYAFVDYQLGAGSHVEILSAADNGLSTPLALIGNDLDNELWGTNGANVLDGGGGADAMLGFSGNDVYYVDDAGDDIYEGAGRGNDIAYTRISYALTGGSEIEFLSASDNNAVVALNLTGNEYGNELWGTNGANVIDGAGGIDVMVGFSGNDIYHVDNAGDFVLEGAGRGYDTVYTSVSFALSAGAEVERLSVTDHDLTTAIDLAGNALANELWGNAGANRLDGGDGNDWLVGFGGADTFAFTTFLGANNVDTIAGFVSGTDRIALDDARFAGLGLGPLNPNAFVVGSAAADADDRIVYDAATGRLFFDADGSGAGAAVHFATLQGHPAIVAGDFIVI